MQQMSTKGISMHRRLFLLSLTAVSYLTVGPAFADPLKQILDAKKVGAGRMTYLTLPVFDATLYAPGGVYAPDKPFALSLTYLRNIKGRDIARNSVEQMRRQGGHSDAKLTAWGEAMTGIFPDVANGTTLTGVHEADGATVFYRGAAEIGRVDDPAFSRAFFDIWLGAKTSQPALRKQLLGAAA
jgi:hypothetical protein